MQSHHLAVSQALGLCTLKCSFAVLTWAELALNCDRAHCSNTMILVATGIKVA